MIEARSQLLDVLSYESSPRPRASRALRRRQWLFLLVALPGALVPFLDYAFSTSPLEVAPHPPISLHPLAFAPDLFDGTGAIYCAAISFFIVFPILLWKLRLMLGPPPGRWERRFAAGASLICALPPLWLLAMMLRETPDALWFPLNAERIRMLSVLIICVFVLILTGWSLLRLCRRDRPLHAIEAALFAAYLINSFICLAAFWNDANAGYYVSIPATLCFGIELALLWRAEPQK